MSRIDDMIREMCPDGVEFRALGEVADLRRGSGMPKSTFTDDGVPAIHYGHIYTRYGVYAGAAAAHVPSDVAEPLQPVHRGELVIANTSENLEDVGMAVAWLGDSNAVTGGHATVVSSGVLDSKFLSYYVRTPAFFAQKRRFAFGTKVIELSAVNLAKIPVPVPPMSIQREIVGILDQFTDLEAELEAELEARKAQATYARTEILHQASLEAPTRLLGDICEVHDSRRKPVKRGDRVAGPYPYFGANGVQDWVDSFIFDGEYVLIGEDGSVMTPDGGPVVTWLSGKAWVNNHAHVVAGSDVLLTRYLFHILQTVDVRPLIAGVPPKLNQANLRGIEISVPTLDRQREVIQALDTLEQLSGSINSGIPAEIAARRQQYEYYRDKLLTFPEKEAGA